MVWFETLSIGIYFGATWVSIAMPPFLLGGVLVEGAGKLATVVGQHLADGAGNTCLTCRWYLYSGRECFAVGTTAPASQTLRDMSNHLLRVALPAKAHGVVPKLQEYSRHYLMLI